MAKTLLMQRASIEKQWLHNLTSAQLHAFCGENARSLVEKSGIVLYVALQAAVMADLDLNHEDIQSMHLAVAAIYSQADEFEIFQTRRKNVISGLLTAEKLIGLIPHETIIDAACKLNDILNHKHVYLEDFKALLNREN